MVPRPSPRFEHAGLRLVALGACDRAVVAPAVDHDAIRRRLDERLRGAPPLAVLAALAADDAAGRAAHWAVHDADGPCGLTALRPAGDALRTVTLLAPRTHGTGVNREVKQVLWAAADLLGVALVARCAPDNLRSRRAIAKLWPAAVAVRVFEPERRRTMLVHHLDGPPAAGTPLTMAARTALWEHLAAFPLCARPGLDPAARAAVA